MEDPKFLLEQPLVMEHHEQYLSFLVYPLCPGLCSLPYPSRDCLLSLLLW